MAQGKQNARQKMINLMYLIFIAMLALNVDREVLRSFDSINTTLETTSNLTEKNNDTFYSNIAKKSQEDSAYLTINAQAKEIKDKTNEFVIYIEGLKGKLKGPDYVKAHGEDAEPDYNALQNTEPIVTLFFKGGKGDSGNQEAQSFVSKIDDYRKFLLNYVKSDIDKDRINSFFSIESPSKNKSWVQDKFYDQPMVAALTNLTKIQADARTEEGNIVRSLLAGKIEERLELNEFKGIILAPGIVRQGDKVPVTVALGAYDNNVRGTAQLNVGSIPINGGTGTFDLNTSGTGQKTITGTILFNGKEYPIDPVTYTVVAETQMQPPSGAIITADKMNVVYRGLDNPISATVNGADGAISLTASVGGLSGSNGKYNFKPAAGSGTVTFTASAKTSSGKTVSGTKEFRIKPVPPARGHILNKTSITVPANGLAAQTVRVDWPDFLFDLTANVNSFKVKVPGQPTASVTGNKMSAAAGVLSKARKGDAVFVFDIKYSSGAISGEASPVTIEVQ